jgi:ABC-type transport system substrate-binding protein
MTLGPTDGSDEWEGLIRPGDIETMEAQGKTVSSRGGFHFCFIGFNYRVYPLSDVNYRHAVAHLVPKDRIIGSLFKYIDVRVDTPVPPAQALWYNPGVDDQAYSPAMAEQILADSGYQKISGEWKDPEGNDLPTMRFFCPLEIVAPTSYTIARMLAEEAEAIGLTNIAVTPMDFSTYLGLVFDEHDFEMYWVCYGLGRFPTHIWWMFHPINDYLGGDNCYGINYPELTAQLDILYGSLDHTAKLVAVARAQELVMGGASTDPLPTYVPPEDARSQALPIITVYSRNYYDIQNPGLRGAISEFGQGLDNAWTWMNIHWDPDDDGDVDYRPGTTDNMVVYVHDEYPERLNPLFATTVYAHQFYDATMDGLIAVNPWTHKDMEWLAESWSYVDIGGGSMDVTFNLVLKDSLGQDIKWQDGVPITVDDVKFNWDFMYEWEIPNFWGAMQFYDPEDTTIVDADTIVARFNRVSQWDIYTLAGLAYYLPPPIWENNPTTGDPWASTAEIIGFDPSAYDPAGPLPTGLYGTGPFINVHSTTEIGVNGYGDLDANRDYWKTTAELHDLLDAMFHSAGDVDWNDVSDGEDVSDIGLAWLTEPGDDLWNTDADVCGEAGAPPDSKVNVYDLSQAGKFYKETKTVPQ